MTTGLRIPVGVNTHGGAATVSGDSQFQKIIGLVLADLDNENAFQQNIGLGQGMIFDPALASFRGKVRQLVISIFADFEKLKLFKLVTSSIRFEDTAEGEQTLNLEYINLESDEVETFKKPFVTKGN